MFKDVMVDSETLRDAISNMDLSEFFWDDNHIYGYTPNERQVEECLNNIFDNLMREFKNAIKDIKCIVEGSEEKINLFDFLMELDKDGKGWEFEFDTEKQEFSVFIWDNFLEYREYFIIENALELYDEKLYNVVYELNDILG